MTYLYFILPPIIIVITTALIFFLLSKKSFDLKDGGKNLSEKKDYSSSDASKKDYAKTQEKLLSILEKNAHWFKVVFLKMHNKIENWLGSIKKSKRIILEKREEDISGIEEISDNDKAKVIEENTAPQKERRFQKRRDVLHGDKGSYAVGSRFKRKNEGVVKRSWRQRMDFSKDAKDPKENVIEKPEVKKEVVREVQKKKNNNAPMVSEDVVYPEAKIVKIKEDKKLEEALVERIASDPRDIEAYEQLGAYYEGRLSYDDAMSCYKYVLKLNPRNKKAERKLTQIQEAMNR